MFYKNRPTEIISFWCQGIFFMNFDFQNECKNEFQDNNEKSCSWFKNRVPPKTDFRVVETHESHPTALELTEIDIFSEAWHAPLCPRWRRFFWSTESKYKFQIRNRIKNIRFGRKIRFRNRADLFVFLL